MPLQDLDLYKQVVQKQRLLQERQLRSALPFFGNSEVGKLFHFFGKKSNDVAHKTSTCTRMVYSNIW